MSSDGERIATLIRTGTETDIWVYDLARDTSTRITFDYRHFLATSPESFRRFTLILLVFLATAGLLRAALG